MNLTRAERRKRTRVRIQFWVGVLILEWTLMSAACEAVERRLPTWLQPPPEAVHLERAP